MCRGTGLEVHWMEQLASSLEHMTLVSFPWSLSTACGNSTNLSLALATESSR